MNGSSTQIATPNRSERTTMPKGTGQRRRWPLLRAAALGLSLGLFGGCHADILKVDLPGTVPADALDAPALAQTLVNGAISDFDCAWDTYVGATNVLSDEFIQSSGNLIERQWADRQITADNTNFAQGTCESGYGLYTPLQTARFQAEDIFNRLDGFTEAQVPKKISLEATMKAYEAFSMIAFGEGFCQAAFDGGPLLQPADVLQLAETTFTDAITLAQQSGTNDILLLAYGGRARVRLDLGDFSGAIADAQHIPEGFEYLSTRSSSDVRRWNIHYYLVNGPQWRHASVAPAFRSLAWKGMADPRVVVTFGNANGFDGVTPWYYHNKTPGIDSPNRLVSYAEAQLIIAEAAARSGDLATARQIINDRHALVGLPPFTEADAPTQDGVIDHVIQERARELFAEGGARFNDHIRFRGTSHDVPFKGEPGAEYPNGVDQSGNPFGNTTCLPLPTVEVNGNPNIGGRTG